MQLYSMYWYVVHEGVLLFFSNIYQKKERGTIWLLNDNHEFTLDKILF